jgi:hypothetical protein
MRMSPPTLSLRKYLTAAIILRKWIEEEERDRKQKRFFTVKGSDGFIHTLYHHDPEAEEWFYRHVERDTGRLN